MTRENRLWVPRFRRPGCCHSAKAAAGGHGVKGVSIENETLPGSRPLRAEPPDAQAPRVEVSRDGESAIVRFSGAWTTLRMGRRETVLADRMPADAQTVRFDLSDIAALDTAGAWVINQAIDALHDRGASVDLVGAGEQTAALIETVGRNKVEWPSPPRPSNALVVCLARVGEGSVTIAHEARDIVNFLGLTVIALARTLLRPWRVRVTALASYIERAGFDALPIVGLISFLIGVVLAYQGADQLARFGAQIFTVNLVGIGVLREMGILLTAIMVAGRSGSAYAAQIGTMVVNEEVDAMRTIGLDPIEVLVVPRTLALIVVLPLLTFYADILGLFGGAIMASVVLDISFVQFARQLSNALTLWDFWVGIMKAPIFGFIIAMIGCYEGLKTTRNAESVGRQTTRAVVKAVFLVIVIDAFFSIFFSVIGI